MAEILAANIKGLRLSLGETQPEFAERLGTSQASVARWEGGSQPKDGTMLFKMAALAGTTPEAFATQIVSYQRRAPVAPRPWQGHALMLPVQLPSEAELTEMFDALLEILDGESDRGVLARRLSQLLPDALAQTAARGSGSLAGAGIETLGSSVAEAREPGDRAPRR